MKVISVRFRGENKLKAISQGVSKEATQRLKWFDYYETHDHNARLTCRHFGISPQTFYRWKRRYDPRRLSSLEEQSRQPRRVRVPTWTAKQASSVARIRQQYPRWGKDKLAVLLRRQGFVMSPSMIGRILRRLKARGELVEPVLNSISARKRRLKRPYATRKPKEYRATEMGDIVEVDTLDLRPLPGLILKHFTAHDVVSKWNVMEVRRKASAATASQFLDTLSRRMPFPIRAIQVDGGSEFQALFEKECQNRGIKLFVLPPRSPKLNGGVERAHRTHTEEFYELTDSDFDLVGIRRELLKWECTYNTIRPHQALGYRTPLQFLRRRKVSPIT